MGWKAEYCEGVNLNQTAKGFTFNFPTKSGHVNLIGREWKPIKPKSIITITYRISGKPKTKFHSLDPSPVPPGLKPNFRPMLFNGDWSDENGRWWPAGLQCATLIADGETHVYTVKVVPRLWTNVWGKYNSAELKSCLKNLKRLYLAFGGGNSFSHGVNNGGAKFELISLKVK